MTPRFWRIVLAIAAKEWLQVVRDRTTAALLVGVPLAQILLFGYAIDLAPRQWPAAWVESGPADPRADIARALLANGGWFRITRTTADPVEARHWLQRGDVTFVVVWPDPASVVSTGNASIRILADLSDPFAGAALRAWQQELGGDTVTASGSSMHVDIERTYAVRHGSGEYLVPALTGVILTLTLTLLAALAVVREVERGTWHGLLTTPAGAGAIVLGKLLPYLALGGSLFTVLMALANRLFDAPLGGPALWTAAALFMLANLGLGLSLSFIARTQMQAMQMGIFFYLPSILLSGFMFPFHAMPAWARGVGELLPLTHFLRCLRASLIRGADSTTVLSLAWPIGVFALVATTVALLGARLRTSA